MVIDSLGPTGGFLRRSGRALVNAPPVLSWTLVLAHGGFIWWLSSFSNVGPKIDSVLWSVLGNLAHAPLFGFLALFVATALLKDDGTGWPRIGVRSVVVVLLIVGLYGAIDEWHQSFTPGRRPSPMDLVTDLVGGSCVLWIGAYLGTYGRTERGLLLRLLAGIGFCFASAALAPFY